jgi:RNA polymerase sigma factor (sigma-70 family)
VQLQSRGRLSPDEQEEALQLALTKMAVNMIRTFRGTTVGEWVEATRTLVKYACMDTQRRAATISKRERGLDDDAGRPDADVFAAIEADRRERERRDEEAERLRERQAFLDWAIPQLSPQRRAVVELQRQGVPVAEIERRLGISGDSVYAARSRALKDLVKLRERYEA